MQAFEYQFLTSRGFCLVENEITLKILGPVVFSTGSWVNYQH